MIIQWSMMMMISKTEDKDIKEWPKLEMKLEQEKEDDSIDRTDHNTMIQVLHLHTLQCMIPKMRTSHNDKEELMLNGNKWYKNNITSNTIT